MDWNQMVVTIFSSTPPEKAGEGEKTWLEKGQVEPEK